MRAVRSASVLAMIGCVQFIFLTTAAMLVYPGGTNTDATTAGYSIWNNFLSDLGRATAHSGDSNAVSLALFVTALSFAAVALALFFLALPRLFVLGATARRLSVAGSFVVVLSAISYLGIAATPWDIYPSVHAVFVYIAFISFLWVVVAYSGAIVLHRRYPRAYALVWIAFAAVLAVYLGLLFAGPSADTESGERVQATGQKIVVYAEIGCMFVQAYGAWRGAGEAASPRPA